MELSLNSDEAIIKLMLILAHADENYHENEEKIIKKIFEWPKIIESASKKYEIHKIPFYLYELSMLYQISF